jgi:hypothetical protein
MDRQQKWPIIPPVMLSLAAIIAGAMICVAATVNAYDPVPYATGEWSRFDLRACTTDSYWYDLGRLRSLDGTPMHLDVVFEDRVESLDLDLDVKEIGGETSGGSSCAQETAPNYTEVVFGVEVPTWVLRNDVQLGHRVRWIVTAFVELDTRQPNTVMTVSFRDPQDNIRLDWTFSYSQAVEAVEAGLDGREMWMLGQ